MELSLSGNALKTFARSITCLSRIGNELAIQASPSQVLAPIHFPSLQTRSETEIVVLYHQLVCNHYFNLFHVFF
jgi:hypothetical protein